MISEISYKITHSLKKNQVINKEDEEVCIYGIEIFISTAITFAIVLILGCLMKCLLASLVYFSVFALIRQICGGYHAKTYFNCNLIFSITTFMVLLSYKYITVDMLGALHYLIMFFWNLSVFIFAPIENENKPIAQEKKQKFKIISRCVSIIMTIITSLIYIKENPFTTLLDFTLLSVSFAMIVAGFCEKGSE